MGVLYGLFIYSEALSERDTFDIRDELKKVKTGREICHLAIYFSKRSLFKMFRIDAPYGHIRLYSF